MHFSMIFSDWRSTVFVTLFIRRGFCIDASMQYLRILQKQACKDWQVEQLILDVLLTCGMNMVLIKSHPRTIPSINPYRVGSTLHGVPSIQTPHVLLMLNASIILRTCLQLCKYGSGGPNAQHLKLKLVSMIGDSFLIILGETTNKTFQILRGSIKTSMFLADVNDKDALEIPFPQLEHVCVGGACTTQMFVSP